MTRNRTIRYAIIANPVSGKMTIDQKRSRLATPAKILKSEIHGLDTLEPSGFQQCAREIADRCDVLVVAGGDGSLSDIINTIDTIRTPIAFLPLGTGNAMHSALHYRGNLADIALRIRNGEIRHYDLINCNQTRKAFMLSVGFDGTVTRLRNQYLDRGHQGFKSYLLAFFSAYFHDYKQADSIIKIDDNRTFEVKNMFSLVVSKQPFYGYRMKIVPRARFDDRQLHILVIESGIINSLGGLLTAFTIGNRIGHYYTGCRLSLKSERPLALQIDGNAAWDDDSFTFSVLPRTLKIKC
ncbi:diacylglycerol/lipid kinase family protein [Thermodesulfobacteriota bacterium]